MDLHWTNCSAEIGYFLDKRFWHHGYATEAAQALMDFCFETLKLLRVADGIPITTVIMAKTR